MRKYTCLLLIVAVLLGLCACAGQLPSEPEVPVASSNPDPELTPVSTPEPAPETSPDATVDHTPEPMEGVLFLTVSEINLSVVGESENIYAGTLPIEHVTWRSDDESVITVSDGVITAVGVGSTTVYAEFDGRTVSCTAGCLAATEDELYTLSSELLRSPKRIPYVPEEPPLDFFADAALIGDSITYILFQYESASPLLGNPRFMTRGGTSLLGIENGYYNIYYQGQDMSIQDSVALCGAKKIFIMLGQNDLGYREIDDTLASYDTILTRILEKTPDVEIYIQSCVPEWAETYGNNSRNEKIELFNQKLIAFAEEKGCHYWDIAKYAVDHTDRMPQPYSLDNLIHLNETGCVAWRQALLAYAYLEINGGN